MTYQLRSEDHVGLPGRDRNGLPLRPIHFQWAIYEGERRVFRTALRDQAERLLTNLRDSSVSS